MKIRAQDKGEGRYTGEIGVQGLEGQRHGKGAELYIG